MHLKILILKGHKVSQQNDKAKIKRKERSPPPPL